MHGVGLRRELLTSLAGAAPLVDVLGDLPLPSHLPTPTERQVLGQEGLSADSAKLLERADPDLCSRVTQALLAVDTSFLDLKEPVESVRQVPDVGAPPLIRAVMARGLPQPLVRLNKLDLDQYSSPPRHAQPSFLHSRDALVPLQATQEPVPGAGQSPLSSKKRRKRVSHEHRLLHEPHRAGAAVTAPPPVMGPTPVARPPPVTRPPPVSRPPPITGPPPPPSAVKRKRGRKPASLTVSIDRAMVTRTQDRSRPAAGIEGRMSLGGGVPNQPALSRPAPSQAAPRPHSDFSVRLSRISIPPPTGTVGNADLEVRRHFHMAGVMSDQVVPSEPQRVPKKKHSRIRGDPAKLSSLRHFNSMLESLFDRADMLDENLLGRATIAQLASEITKLKQQDILPEVPVDSLVRLMGIVDKHILDAAELQLNVIPDDSEMDPRLLRELTRDRILRGLDASLVVLHVTTARNMPRQVYLEESIEQVVAITTFHLEKNVYPEFDPVYRAESKDTGVLPRQKRRYAAGTTNKHTLALYHKLTEVVENLALLLETQPLTDITVLQLSTLGTFPFFVENVNVLQLSALRLVRAVFSRYERHRELILEDIFSSLARLPTTKRNLRSFRLSSGESIQMVTALILQLVQCIVVLPSPEANEREATPTGPDEGRQSVKPDADVQLVNSYELALRTGKNFLSTFLKKCCGGKDEENFRPLFDNFVQDLLTTLNLPEWPASELLLTLLGMLLVHSFSSRSSEQSLRLMCLEHLGVIAARLRRDATAALDQDHQELIDILAQILQSKLERRTPSPTSLTSMDAFSENSQHLQKALIAYLNRRIERDPSCSYARDFYLGQWLRDTQVELEKALKGGGEDGPMETLGLEEEELPVASLSAAALQQAQLKTEMLHALMDPKNHRMVRHLEGVLDDRSALVVTRFLASSRALSKSFDKYLQQLLRVSNEPAVHVRNRAMKALSTIIAADPSILSRPDMQRGVQCRFMDQSTLVREATVDLVGRFILSRPELTSQYYDMLSERMLDMGVSVRKRVIKIMKDICVQQPDFSRVNEICVKMIRRINDEEGIKHLVTSVFRELWFTLPPEGAEKKDILVRRVTTITAVVGSCKEHDWFEQLIEEMLKGDNASTMKEIMSVCQMMVNTLVENVLALDENAATVDGSNSGHLVACITTVYLFCKIKPSLLLGHATTLHPYLSSECSSQNDMLVLHYVAQVLRQVVPLLEHPSEAFLASLEEDLVRLIMRHGQIIVQSCVSCLSAVVNTVTHNFTLVNDCFLKFFNCLERVRSLRSQNPKSTQLASLRPSLLRSLFTVGLICRYFDVDPFNTAPTQASPMSQRVYSHLMYFSKHDDEEVQLKAVNGLGFLFIRYPELMLEQDSKLLYQEWLTKDQASKKKCQVLRNLQNHLKEVESTLKVADKEWSQTSDKENLVEFGDLHSSVSSNIAQAFISPILKSFLHQEIQVRLTAVQAVELILKQGLIHPVQCIPFLIAMSSDPEQSVKLKADQLLSDHCSRYGHFMQGHLLGGVRKAFEFQLLISGGVTRGCSESASNPLSLLGHIYSLSRGSKQHRRAFLRALLRHFEDYEKNSLALLLFLADNLAFFPYNVIEEPLFVLHHIDLTISVTGSSILQAFKEALGSKSTEVDDDDEDLQTLSQKECDAGQLAVCCHSSLGCSLLLLLKQHLKHLYGLTDSKCQRYSPTDTGKAYEKAVSRKMGLQFEPVMVVAEIHRDLLGKQATRSKEESLKQYLEFKQLMNHLDALDGEEDASDQEQTLQEPQKTASSTDNTAIAEVPVQPMPRRARSLSRRSSASSVGSAISVKPAKHSADSEKSRRRKRVIVSSDESDDDPSFY